MRKNKSREKQIAIEREQKRAEIGAKYDASHWMPVLYKDKEQYIEDKLKTWENQLPEIPQGKYQDFRRLQVIYQQKFLEAMRDIKPQVFEDLRGLTKHFRVLFGDGNNYASIMDSLERSIFDASSGLQDVPAWNRNVSYSRKLLEVPLQFTRLVFYNSIGKDWKVKSAVQNAKEIQKIITDAFSSNEHEADLILESFLTLRLEIYQWVDRYYLPKDWLLKSAFYIISQFNKNESLAVKDIEIPLQRVRPFIAFDFKFERAGWEVEKEKAEDYRRRITKDFQEALEQYFDRAHRDLRLDKIPTITRPKKNYESVRWLVRRNVQGWDNEKIVDLELHTALYDKKYERQVKYVGEKMKELEAV